MKNHKSTAYLVNTGWIGGGYGVGEELVLKIQGVVLMLY